jgi:small subunit ribosomal protein S21
MLIIKVEKNNIEKALKNLKGKVIKTKQNDILRARQAFVKKSVVRRSQINKAKYLESKNNNED